MTSQWLVDKIKNSFVNDTGLVSATYPPSERHLLPHLDDYIPFLLYYGESDFAKRQILNSEHITGEHGLVLQNNRIVSYSNNEFVGCIANYYRSIRDEYVKLVLDRAMEGVKKLLTREGMISSYYCTLSHKTSPIIVPIAGGLIEVLLKNEDIYPEMAKIAYNSLDRWISSDPFKRYGLFLSKQHMYSNIWNQLFRLTRVPISLRVQNRLGVNFFMQGRWNNPIFGLPIGIKVQTSKDNSSMVFALIQAFRNTKSTKYSDALKWWIERFSVTMMIDKRVYRYWQLYGKPKGVALDHVFPVIDILCDTYAFVEKDETYVKKAEKILVTCLDEMKWKIGLFPKTYKGNHNHLDIETDFIVSLRRLSELTGENTYRQMANDLFEAILEYHRTEDGFVTSVNRDGHITQHRIEPKYNALLLKACILMENKDFKIYSSDFNHSLMEDR